MATEEMFLKPESISKVVSPLLKKKNPTQRASLLRSTHQNAASHQRSDENFGEPLSLPIGQPGQGSVPPQGFELEKYGNLVSKSLDCSSKYDQVSRKRVPSIQVSVGYASPQTVEDALKAPLQHFSKSFQDPDFGDRGEEPSIAEGDASVATVKPRLKAPRLQLKSKRKADGNRLSIFEMEMKTGADFEVTPTPPRIVIKKKMHDSKLPSIRMKCNSTDVTKASMTSGLNANSPYNLLTVPGLNGQQVAGSNSSLDLDECDLVSGATPWTPLPQPPRQFHFSNLPLRDIQRSFAAEDPSAADRSVPKVEPTYNQVSYAGLESIPASQFRSVDFSEDQNKNIWNEFKRLPSIQPTQISIPRETSLGAIVKDSANENGHARVLKAPAGKKIAVLRRCDTIELQEELDLNHQARGTSIDLGARKGLSPLECRKSQSLVANVDPEYKQKVSRWLFSKNSLNSLPKQDVLKHIEHMRKDYEEAKRFQRPAQPINKVILSKVDRSKLEADIDKKFLVLDLDETLVNAKFEGDSANQKVFDSSKVKIAIRPHAAEFLKEMAEVWNLIVFTASDKKYADYVVDLLDPECKYIANVCYRNQCEAVSRHLVKDLRSFYSNHVKEENMLIVDNRIVSFGYQIYNGIPILPFYGDMRDTELRGLKSYLKRLAQPEMSIQKTLRERYRYSETFKAAA